MNFSIVPVTIENISALQILDSRGIPTLEVEVELSDRTRARAQVPSGRSTGRHEALELRDGPAAGSYQGKSVLRAAGHIEGEIAAALSGTAVEDQVAIDRRMIELDGTENKSRLGANAILGVSAACARAAAQVRGVPLWRSLAAKREAVLPIPMINILSGGLHAGGQIEFQDFLAVPHGFRSFADSLEAAVGIHRAMERLLREDGFAMTGVADEGGLGPRLKSNEQALDFMMRAVEAAGFEPEKQVSFAIDVASSHFERDGAYHLRSEGRTLSALGMVGRHSPFRCQSLGDFVGGRHLAGGEHPRLQLLSSLACGCDDLVPPWPSRYSQTAPQSGQRPQVAED